MTKYFVDHLGNLEGQVLTDEPINYHGFHIVDLDLPMEKAHLYLFDSKKGLIPNMRRYTIEMKAKRDADLLVSDRLVFPDRWATYTDEYKERVSAYRQALRDLPQHPDWPMVKDEDWPRMPN